MKIFLILKSLIRGIAFSFSVVCMPFSQSNIPSKMIYSTISAEFFRKYRDTFKHTNFLLSREKLFIRMIKQKLLFGHK